MSFNNDVLGWPLAAYGTIIRGDDTTSEDQVAEAVTPEVARRIVACVNACEGIDTEWLENNGAYAVPVPSLRTLLNQRDAAERALKDAGFTRCDGPAGWRPPLGKPAGPMIDEIDRLRAEVYQLRKDAERYRWLRDGNDDKGSVATRIAVNCYGLEWNDAIDAAMQGLKP